MADLRTEVSEIVTGLGLFGFRDLERALAARPRFITNVNDIVYDRLDEAFAAKQHAEKEVRRVEKKRKAEVLKKNKKAKKKKAKMLQKKKVKRKRAADTQSEKYEEESEVEEESEAI